jgi:erythronate-4-phosphate dehydrogenase
LFAGSQNDLQVNCDGVGIFFAMFLRWRGVMQIVVDENISLADYFFMQDEPLIKKSGRMIISEDLLMAEALLVRSVTQVSPALLVGSSVRFVGSATIGTDHLDIQGLRQMGVTVANAAGCNAQAVAEYVVSVILTLQPERALAGDDFTLGIIGLGNVGVRLAALAQRMGWRVIGHDPLVLRAGIDQRSLADVLAHADAVSLHVPITHDGAHPTVHLIGAAQLSAMKPNAMLINSARGEVVAEADLMADIRQTGRLVVLDVFEHEPQVSAELLALLALATPHIAGYSLEGKIRGTYMLYQAFCAWQGVPECKTMDGTMPAETGLFDVQQPLAPQVLALLPQLYDVRRDDAALRACLNEGKINAADFDRLRRDYPLRREWSAYGDVAHV